MCLAHYINDKHFSVDIIENGDIHTWTQQTLGFETRRQAKTFEYAYLYGAGKRNLQMVYQQVQERNIQLMM